jgi:hypothetical protein
MGVLKAEQHMTAERAERVAFAEEIAERQRNPLDVCHRPGGYTLNSAGYPIDAEGRLIPQAEWKPEDRERLLGKPVVEEGAFPTPRADGADVVEPSGSEKRTNSRAQVRSRVG